MAPREKKGQRQNTEETRRKYKDSKKIDAAKSIKQEIKMSKQFL